MEKYEYIENIIKESSTTFYKAFSELPEKKRNAVYSIYAFCRIADDAVDVHKDVEQLKTLKENIKKTFDGDVPEDPVFQTLYETIMAFPSSLEPYVELIDGLMEDFNKKPIKTDADLEDYTYKVAGTVGLMLIPVVAQKSYKENHSDLKAVAIELGKAMQITNILRDVRDDLIKRRVYFPDEAVDQHDVKIETLRTGTVTAEYRSLVETYIEMAKSKYKIFYDNIGLFDEDSIYPTYLAARFYEGILDEIRKGGYSNITKRHFVGKIRKFFMIRKVKKELKQKGFPQ